jgi:hypothetical protein
MALLNDALMVSDSSNDKRERVSTSKKTPLKTLRMKRTTAAVTDASKAKSSWQSVIMPNLPFKESLLHNEHAPNEFVRTEPKKFVKRDGPL